MSTEIVNAIGSYSTNNRIPLMIIASRNQVDANGGYVMTTTQLAEQVKGFDREYLWLCRDHCGPYFLDSEKTLSQKVAVEATKQTIAKDIEVGFDLIHIDTSRCEDGYHVAEDLIKFCLDLNPRIQFEFGTEENVGVAAGLEKYKHDVAFASQFPNMQFVVAQTGSLVMEDRQVGTFDVDIVKQLVGYANDAGIKLKEHNADYLTTEQIQLRKEAGVHALNIAPQLGVLQTKLLKEYSYDLKSVPAWNTFSSEVLNSNKWSKWHIDGDTRKKIDIAGHYLYQSVAYQELKRSLGMGWQKQLTEEVHDLIDMYVKNI